MIETQHHAHEVASLAEVSGPAHGIETEQPTPAAPPAPSPTPTPAPTRKPVRQPPPAPLPVRPCPATKPGEQPLRPICRVRRD